MAVLASLFERFTLAALRTAQPPCLELHNRLRLPAGLRLTNSLGEGGELTDETVEQARGFYRYSVRLRQPSCSRASRRTL